MRLVVFEGVKYVVIETKEDEECIKVIKKALHEQAEALEEASVEEVVEDVLDLREEAHGVLCWDEVTKGY